MAQQTPNSYDEKEEVNISPGVKRYNLVIPEALFNETKKLAESQNTTVLDLFRRFIKLGLIAAKASQNPDSAIIIREGGRDREIFFLT